MTPGNILHKPLLLLIIRHLSYTKISKLESNDKPYVKTKNNRAK